MGLFDEILKGLPVNPILREKVADAEAKYAAAETENAGLKDDLREAKTEIAKLKNQVEELTHRDDLDELELRLLHRIAKLDYDNSVPEVFAQGFEVSKARFEYHL